MISICDEETIKINQVYIVGRIYKICSNLCVFNLFKKKLLSDALLLCRHSTALALPRDLGDAALLKQNAATSCCDTSTYALRQLHISLGTAPQAGLRGHITAATKSEQSISFIPETHLLPSVHRKSFPFSREESAPKIGVAKGSRYVPGMVWGHVCPCFCSAQKVNIWENLVKPPRLTRLTYMLGLLDGLSWSIPTSQ